MVLAETRVWAAARWMRDEVHLRRLTARLEADHGPPLIVVGMHRSGTSLVARLLRSCGGYFGCSLQATSEATEFIRLNDELLTTAGSAWNLIGPHSSLLDDGRLHAAAARQLVRSRHHLRPFFEHFGEQGTEADAFPPPTSRQRDDSIRLNWPPKAGRAPFWGWKDPRTTLTLAVWLRLFPKGRVLHVIRSGIHSALSLWVRCKKRGIGAPHCLDLVYCFRLWEAYVAKGLKWRALPAGRYYEVKYEDLLTRPERTVGDVVSFAHPAISVPDGLCDQIEGRGDRDVPSDEYSVLMDRAASSRLFRELYGNRVELSLS